MFSDVLYLLVVLLLASFTPPGNESGKMISSSAAFWTRVGVYMSVLLLIYVQNKACKNILPRQRGRILSLVNIYLILFLAFDHFILSPYHLFSSSLAFVSAFSLLLYFFGLFVFHTSSYPYLARTRMGSMSSSIFYAWRQISLTLPLVLPFLVISFLLDLAELANERWKALFLYQSNHLAEMVISLTMTGIFLLFILLFFPPLLQKFWACKTIDNQPIRQRLEDLCQRAGFRHGGIKIWTVMNHAYTAAIIGILPRFRYVIFSQKILDALPQESLEAILAHEIGHNYRKHLLIYPFILMGMTAGTGLFSLFFSESIDTYFSSQAALTPSPFRSTLYPFAVFIPYLTMIFLYLRYVFGFFSRLFEREADLHVFHLGIPAAHMQQALDAIGTLTGKTHDHPNWHHGSIQERMEFLEKAAHQPSLITKHRRKVIASLFIYGFLLFLASAILISPLLAPLPPFQQVATFCQETSQRLSHSLRHQLRRQL